MIIELVKYAAWLGLRKAASLPADLALRVTNIPFVMDRLERRYTASLQNSDNLSAIEAAAVAQLQQTGVFVTNLDSLGCSPEDAAEIMEHGKRLTARLASRGSAAGSVRSAVTISNPADLLDYPMIYRFGLNPIILGIIKAYLRSPVAYDGPLAFHAPADGRETGSRRWHLDREDRRVVKVGLYLHDVSDTGGPFQLVNLDTRLASEPFRYANMDTRRLEQTFGERLAARTITCPGKAGTLIFAETGKFFHRGKPATSSERSTIFFSYFARAPRHPFYCARSGLSRSNLTGLIKGFSSEQQAAALWRDALPLIARLIPPSLV